MVIEPLPPQVVGLVPVTVAEIGKETNSKAP
jgi:hypothetical protein